MTASPAAPTAALTEAVYRLTGDGQNRYRVEDVISSAAAFLGEAALRQAGDFNADAHPFRPGSPVLSDAANRVLSGDETAWPRVPADSVFGALRQRLTARPAQSWRPETFPDLSALYAGHAARLSASDVKWGFVALSVPEENRPRVPPLFAAYQLRLASQAWGAGFDAGSRVAVGLAVLAELLDLVRAHIDETVVLALAFETINAMAKTAPLLPQHFEEAGSANRS